MADLDDLREGSNFGLGVSSQQQSFHVKGAENLPWGMKDRLSRIFNPKTGKAVMLAFDHGFIMGPTSGLERIDLNIVPLIEYADCIMCTRGILQTSIPANINKPVCLRSDAGSTILTELISKPSRRSKRSNASACPNMSHTVRIASTPRVEMFGLFPVMWRSPARLRTSWIWMTPRLLWPMAVLP